VLYTRGDSRSVAMNDLTSYGLQLAGALVLLTRWPERATPQAGLLVLGLSSAAGVALGLWQLRDHAQFRGIGRERCVAVWREAWGFGKWLTAQSALSWFGAQGHVWLVAILLGPGPVGVYRATTHFAHLLNPLRQAAYSYLPSRGSVAYERGGASALSRWVRRTGILLLAALLPPSLMLIAFAGDVLRLAYGARYSGPHMALILGVATLAQLVMFWKFPFDIGLLALRATRRIFYVNLVPVPLLLVAGTALVYFLGVLGAPLSSTLISVALLVATRSAYRRVLAQSAQPASPAAQRCS
jgi:O-antigen/teichoic acid export membrane protein